MKNNQRVAFEHLADFFEYVTVNANNDISISQHCFLQLTSSIYRTIYEWYGFCLERLPTERESFLLLLKEDTSEKMYIFLVRFVEGLFSFLEETYAETKSQLSFQVVRFINTHYAEDLSLDYLMPTEQPKIPHHNRKKQDNMV